MVYTSTPLIAEFTKMSGAGNDFVVLDNRFYQFSGAELSAIAQHVCRRRHGIGADGILALGEAQSERCDYRMIYYNADGSEGSMCGNGARCIARYARNAGFNQEQVVIETTSGAYPAQVKADPSAEVRIWFKSPTRWQPNFTLQDTQGEGIAEVHFLWPGTEHLVCFTDSLCRIPVQVLGPAIRSDGALAPDGANVNFVEVAGAAALRVRTYEKGVEAETQACGTGAVASAAAAVWSNRLEADRIAVHMPGGILRVGMQKDVVYLQGPAVTVYRGSVDIPRACLNSGTE